MLTCPSFVEDWLVRGGSVGWYNSGEVSEERGL